MEGLRTSRERLVISEAGERIGSASGLAVVQARLDLSADSSALLDLMQQQELSITRLNTLLGQAPDTPIDVPNEIPQPASLDLPIIQNNPPCR